jgi:class 3 adenylate cyclase
MLGLWLLLAQPAIDVHLEHHLGHALVVGAAALVSGAVALAVRSAARRHADARLTLVSLVFLTPAAFLFVHAWTTPQVLVGPRTTGFVAATEVGLVVAAVLAVWSALPLTPAAAAWVLRAEPWLLAALGLVVVGWSALALVPTAWLGRGVDPDAAGPLAPAALAGVVLYLGAATGYWRLYRRRRSVVLLSIVTAFVLLAEALLAVALSRTWALSWWEWHVLLLLGFAFVAYSARLQVVRERSTAPVFSGVALDETVQRLQEGHRAALGELVAAIEQLSEGRRDAADVHPAAVEVGRRFDLTEAQVAVLEEAASAQYEVERLRRQVEQLFSLYLSPDVATGLIADPARAELGGTTREVSVLFADLRGFTPFTEATPPEEVVAVLNAYFREAVPAVLDAGGTVVQFIGDALMAVFNAPRPLEDHAYAAATAALELQRRAERVAAGHPGWPRFRVGVSTGPALVGNVGGRVRSYTAIGDATNLAARLEALAEPGQVVLGPQTRAALGARADVTPLGALEIKGKSAPVEAFVLVGLRKGAPVGDGS